MRFVSVWLSTGRAVGERGEWRVVAGLVYVVVAVLPREASTFLVCVLVSVPGRVWSGRSLCVDLHCVRIGCQWFHYLLMWAVRAVAVVSPRVRREFGGIDRHVCSVSPCVRSVGRRSPSNVAHNLMVSVVVSGVSLYSSWGVCGSYVSRFSARVERVVCLFLIVFFARDEMPLLTYSRSSLM